jgi:hypothetical protein
MLNVNVEQNRAAIKAALKVNPGRSNRYIGRLVGVHHVTVGLVRRLMENAGEMPRMEAMLGADGKSYSRDRAHAPAKTSSLDDLLSTALTSLTCDVRKEGRVGELASALKRHAQRLSIEAKQSNSDGHVAGQAKPEPAIVAGSSDTSTAPAPGEPPQPATEPPPALRTWRDVARDIAVETERRALANEVAEERHPSDGVERSGPAERDQVAPHQQRIGADTREPDVSANRTGAAESWWERAQVCHLHQLTQCGRVRVDDGELNFSDHTPREAGLVLRTGMDVDVRLVERKPGWVQVVELAQVEA